MIRTLTAIFTAMCLTIAAAPLVADEAPSGGQVLQMIRIESTLTRDGVIDIAETRAHQFREVPGLVQKFYFETGEPNHYGGLYVWESRASMAAFMASDLAKTMGAAYELAGPPSVEFLDLLFRLHE